MKKLLDKIKKKLLSSVDKKNDNQKNVKNTRTFPKQKTPLK